MAKIADTPDFVICLECETPCYEFEWKGGALAEALCTCCGNDEVDQFATEDEIEAMAGHWDTHRK
jgi:hypothetical protein